MLLIQFIFNCIWLVLALVIWIIALVMFVNSEEDGFVSWLASGGLCLIPILLPFFRFLINMIRNGSFKGSQTYDVNYSYGHVTFSNRRFLYGFLYLLLGILLGLFAGLIVLPIYFFYQVYRTIVLFLNWKNFTPPSNPNP